MKRERLIGIAVYAIFVIYALYEVLFNGSDSAWIFMCYLFPIVLIPYVLYYTVPNTNEQLLKIVFWFSIGVFSLTFVVLLVDFEALPDGLLLLTLIMGVISSMVTLSIWVAGIVLNIINFKDESDGIKFFVSSTAIFTLVMLFIGQNGIISIVGTILFSIYTCFILYKLYTSTVILK